MQRCAVRAEATAPGEDLFTYTAPQTLGSRFRDPRVLALLTTVILAACSREWHVSAKVPNKYIVMCTVVVRSLQGEIRRTKGCVYVHTF